MDHEERLRNLCKKNGSTLASYTRGRSAFVVLSSMEPIIVSIGVTTAKIAKKRPLLGWYLPKKIASERIEIWDEQFYSYNSFLRLAARGLVLDGLIILLSKCRSVEDILTAWGSLDNPSKIGSFFFSKYGEFAE